MSRILVIGASGFLGQHLLAIAPEQTMVGTFFSRAEPGLIFLDVRERSAIDRVMSQIKPGLVLYAAGLTDVDRCEEAKEEAQALNCSAPGYFASFGNVRVFYFSTDYVFDGARGGYSEDEEPQPLNYYGMSKLAGECEVLKGNSRNAVIRVSGLYDSDGMKGKQFAMLDDGTQSIEADDRRFSNPVHVRDVVFAARAILESGEGGIFHVGGPDDLSRYEFNQIVSLHVPGSPFVRLANNPSDACRAQRPRDSSLRTGRLRSLGWRAAGVADLLQERSTPRKVLISDAMTSHAAKPSTAGLLVDCIGTLLTRRTWLPVDSTVEHIDRQCGTVVDGNSFWKQATKDAGKELNEIPVLQEEIVRRYTPNATVWNTVREWRSSYRLALVNNGASATFRRWVQKYGLGSIFDVIGNSEELGVSKPCSEFFLQVAARLGLPPQRCVLIDNDPENVEGARLCGMSAIISPELGGHPFPISSWREALESA